MSSPGDTRRPARALRRARLLTLAATIVAAASFVALLVLEPGFSNLDCPFDADELEREPLGLHDCREDFAPTPEMVGVLTLVGALATLAMTLAIRRHRAQPDDRY